MSDFIWDPEKEAQNLRKHHVDFTSASLIWVGPVFEKPDDRRDYGERRFVVLVPSKTAFLPSFSPGEAKPAGSLRRERQIP
jgi:uncharacterized DUF497 family protein